MGRDFRGSGRLYLVGGTQMVQVGFRRQITTLAQALRRNRSWVIEEAVRGYIQLEQQFIEAVQEGIRADDAGDVVAHEAVMAEAEALLSSHQPSEQ